MTKRQTWFLGVVLLGLLAALVACQRADVMDAGNCLVNEINEVGDYTNGCSLNVSADAAQAAWRMQAEMSTGTMAWTITDANGVVQRSGRAAAGEIVNDAHTFVDPAPGRWELTVELNDAAGRYEAEWQAE